MNTPLPLWYQNSMVRPVIAGFCSTNCMQVLDEPHHVSAQQVTEIWLCLAECVPHHMLVDKHLWRRHLDWYRFSPSLRIQQMLSVSLSQMNLIHQACGRQLIWDRPHLCMQHSSPTRGGSGCSSFQMLQCFNATIEVFSGHALEGIQVARAPHGRNGPARSMPQLCRSSVVPCTGRFASRGPVLSSPHQAYWSMSILQLVSRAARSPG